jgi:hypothetical protein
MLTASGGPGKTRRTKPHGGLEHGRKNEMGSMVVLYSGREGIKDDRWSARVAAAVQKLCGVVGQLMPEHVRYVAERDPQFGMYTLGRSDACICTTYCATRAQCCLPQIITWTQVTGHP